MSFSWRSLSALLSTTKALIIHHGVSISANESETASAFRQQELTLGFAVLASNHAYK
jgi:hypothetical protein